MHCLRLAFIKCIPIDPLICGHAYIEFQYSCLWNSFRLRGRILISHERIKNQAYVKFPGGGLEYGEGPKDGLVREFQEELNLDVEVGKLLYATDFFIQSAFKEEDQIISIYYQVSARELATISTSDVWPTKESVIEAKQIFQWIGPENLKGEKLSFPGDRAMLKRLLETRD